MSSDSSPVLILIHGLLSTPQEFFLLTQPLKLRHVDCIALRVPFYSEHSHRDPNAWRDWARSAWQEIQRLVPPGRPIVLGGLCMGGVLAAALALMNPDRCRKLVLLAPTFDYDGWGLSPWTRWRRLGYALGLTRWISVRERHPYGIKNERIRARIVAQMKAQESSIAGPSSLPLWAIREGERMMSWVRQQLPELKLPTLVMHARQDEICTLLSVQRLVARIGSRDKQLVVLEDSYHLITIDNDRMRVADSLASYCASDAPMRDVAKFHPNASRRVAA